MSTPSTRSTIDAKAAAFIAPFGRFAPSVKAEKSNFSQSTEMREPLGPQRRGQDGDEAVILAVAIVAQRLDRRIGQRLGRRSGGKRHLAQHRAGIVKRADDGAAAVIAPREQRRCHLHEAPGQRQRPGRIGGGDLFADRAQLAFQISDQRLAVLPVHETPRPRDAGQPFGHLAPGLLRALRPCQCQPKPPLGHGGSGADLDQQFGQTGSAQRLEVLCIRVVFDAIRNPYQFGPTLAAAGAERNADAASFLAPISGLTIDNTIY